MKVPLASVARLMRSARKRGEAFLVVLARRMNCCSAANDLACACSMMVRGHGMFGKDVQEVISLV